MIDTAALLQSIDLTQLLERDMEHAKGNRFWCGFCQPGGSANNNSPALLVSGQYIHCFGCGASGDAIDYIMRRDNVDFAEACKRLGWDGVEPDKAQFHARRIEQAAQRQAEQERRAADLDALLADYSAEEIWNAYNRRLTSDHRTYWTNRGIPEGWQDYLKLGFIPDKIYRGKDGELHHSPAYTIPYFHTGWEFKTLQYRLDNPQRPQDRYRFEQGLPSTYYQTRPDDPIGEYAIIAEGAIKAAVADIWGDTGDSVALLAVPSKTSAAGVVQAVAQCRKVWIVLDPDCWQEPKNAPHDWEPAPIKLAKLIGKAARVVRLPGKLDDMLLDGFTASAWKAALKDGRAV